MLAQRRPGTAGASLRILVGDVPAAGATIVAVVTLRHAEAIDGQARRWARIFSTRAGARGRQACDAVSAVEMG